MVSLTLLFASLSTIAALPVAEPQLDQILGLAGLGGNAGAKGAAGAGPAGGLLAGLGGAGAGAGAGGLLDGVFKTAGIDAPIDLGILDNPASALGGGAGGAAPVAAKNGFANAKKP